MHSWADFTPLEGGSGPLGGRAPNWLGRQPSAAAALGFGGKLAALRQAPDEHGAVHRSVSVSQVRREGSPAGQQVSLCKSKGISEHKFIPALLLCCFWALQDFKLHTDTQAVTEAVPHSPQASSL